MRRPLTQLGKWALTLMAGCMTMLLVLVILTASGQRGGETFADNLWLGIPGLAGAIFGLSAFFVGCLAILRSRERSVQVYLTTLFGFLLLMFLVGEFAFPE